MQAEYRTCLPDWESVLPALARLIGARYQDGTFTQAEEAFHATGDDAAEWLLQGGRGSLTILLEKYEGYSFASFRAAAPVFEQGVALLRKHYLAQGGNPDAME